MIALGIVACMSQSASFAQKLEKFGADMGKKSVMGKEVRIPYTDVISYYGYIKPGLKPDAEKGGKKFYYIYVWIPAAAPEIGIRMISPVPEKQKDRGSFYDRVGTLRDVMPISFHCLTKKTVLKPNPISIPGFLLKELRVW